MPKRLVRLSLVLVGLLVLAVSGAILPRSRSAPSVADAVHALPPVDLAELPEVGISVLHTGYAEGPKAVMVERSSLLEGARAEHAAILVEHPRGRFLFETGLGRDVDAQFEQMPLWAKMMFAYRKGRPAVEQLGDHGLAPEDLDFIVLSHLHWDHASGVPDFPGVEVVVGERELEFARSSAAEPPAFLPVQYQDPAVNWRTIEFDGEPYGPFPASHDLFGDGSIRLVPMAGHTPGALGMLVHLRSGARLLFVGDAVWRHEGVVTPARKSRLAECVVDHDPGETWGMLRRLHDVHLANPDVLIVPSHDFDALRGIASFPERMR